MKELIIEAKPENLDNVIDFVSAELESADCPIKTQTQITIAVEEVFINIASYAYAPETGGAVVRISVTEGEAIIEFEDSGRPYNPLEKDDPDITVAVEERQIGGLGVFMVKKIMDFVEYRFDSGKNVLVMKKRIKPWGSAPNPATF